ncbi:protein of unknown function [Rhodovastum atsumiense]|nr:protein of unknown function [Rhodovastum atsumiense]
MPAPIHRSELSREAMRDEWGGGVVLSTKLPPPFPRGHGVRMGANRRNRGRAGGNDR